MREALLTRPVYSDYLPPNPQEQVNIKHWLVGRVHSVISSHPVRTITIETTHGFKRPTLTSFRLDTLHPQSKVFPKGTPVKFLTYYSPPNPDNKKGQSKLADLVIDNSREDTLLENQPARKMIDLVSDRHGQPTLMLGVHPLQDIRGIGPLDLLDLNTKPEWPSIQEMVAGALGILEKRIKKIKELIDTETQDDIHKSTSELDNKHDQLLSTIDTIKNHKPITLFVTPNSINRKTWINIASKSLSGRERGGFNITKIILFDKVHKQVNTVNVRREAGLLQGMVDRWKTDDLQTAHHIYAAETPFVKISEDDQGTWRTTSYHDNYLTQYQLLTVVMETGGVGVLGATATRTVVPTNGLETDQREDLDLGVLREYPSLTITYRRTRGKAAREAIARSLGPLSPEYTPCPHPDPRMISVRAIFNNENIDTKQLNLLSKTLNSTSLNHLLHATNFDLLHQDKDNSLVRTLLCRAGHSPPLEALLKMDPDMQVRYIDSGVLRIFSTLSTDELICKMRLQNKVWLDTDPPRGRTRTGELSTYQVLLDDQGANWIGEEASPPPSFQEGPDPWLGGGGSLTDSPGWGVYDYSLTGISPAWTQDSLNKVLNAFGIPSCVKSNMKWGTVNGSSRKALFSLGPYSPPLTLGRKVFQGFISISLEKISEKTGLTVGNSVFKEKSIDINEMVESAKKVVVLLAKDNTPEVHENTLGITEGSLIAKLDGIDKNNPVKGTKRLSVLQTRGNGTHGTSFTTNSHNHSIPSKPILRLSYNTSSRKMTQPIPNSPTIPHECKHNHPPPKNSHTITTRTLPVSTLSHHQNKVQRSSENLNEEMKTLVEQVKGQQGLNRREELVRNRVNGGNRYMLLSEDETEETELIDLTERENENIDKEEGGKNRVTEEEEELVGVTTTKQKKTLEGIGTRGKKTTKGRTGSKSNNENKNKKGKTNKNPTRNKVVMTNNTPIYSLFNSLATGKKNKETKDLSSSRTTEIDNNTNNPLPSPSSNNTT